MDEPVLECQDCGRVVGRLSADEAKMVADNPYDYIVYCFECRRRMEIENGFYF